MWRNYLKITLRNLVHRKFYTFINITGLSIGLASSLLIICYIADEFSYDTFHKDAERIYRVHTRARLAGKDMNTCYSSAPISADLKREIPEVIDGCRITIWHDINIRYEDQAFSEKKVLLADSNFFSFFSFKLKHGNPNTALKEPNSIILTETTAQKYFGEEIRDHSQFLGRLITIGLNDTYEITGIAADPPGNSHFKYNVILSMESWDYSHNPSWLGNNLQNYIKLNEYADYHLVDKKFPDLVEKYIGPQVQQVLGISLQQFYDQGGDYGFYLQPMLRIHLYPLTQGELEPPGNIKIIYLLSAIVLLIIIIACINFMNLSTACYTDRIKEVGVRKSLGATRKRLMGQFIGESLIMTILSMFMAILLLWLSLGEFNMISDKTITMKSLLDPQLMGGMGILILVVGFLAGSYPAIYLTSFSPIDILRSKIDKGLKTGKFRSYFVLFQFTMSIALIISTLLIFKQLKYVQNKDLGFGRENVLVLRNTEGLGKDKLAFKEELCRLNDVSNVSITNHTPPDFNQSTVFKALGGAQEDFPSTYCIADMDHASTLDLEMAAGRYFSKDFPSDSSAVVVNETTARLLGWDDPIGQKIETYWREGQSDIREVIGVVKDFHFQSLHKEMSSLFIFYGTSGNKMLIRLTAGNIQEKIKLIEAKWKVFAPGQPFDFSFVDADFDAKFKQDQQMGKIFLIFTALALFVACLGLLGLATFMAEQRSKEIGIRKVMGASNPRIIHLLSFEYLKLVGISFFLSIPLTYMLVNWWLSNFAYKTNIGIVSFLLGGGITLVIAMVSVSYHSIKAALRNPVESLRYE